MTMPRYRRTDRPSTGRWSAQLSAKVTESGSPYPHGTGGLPVGPKSNDVKVAFIGVAAVVAFGIFAFAVSYDGSGGQRANVARTPSPTYSFSESDVARAIGADLSFMPRASREGMAVIIRGNAVTVSIEPKLLNEADTLTVASHTALAVSKVLWANFPQAERLDVTVRSVFTDAVGAKRIGVAASLEVSRQTAARFVYDGLKERVMVDNKHLFCLADRYSIHPAVYARIKDAGCLTGRGR
jgi:hypothetical protein